jgi:hypothetical protein
MILLGAAGVLHENCDESGLEANFDRDTKTGNALTFTEYRALRRHPFSGKICRKVTTGS